MTYPYTYLDSPFVGPYYKMLCDLNYPQLDITVLEDGEWYIYEMLNAPVVPSLTKWQPVYKGFRNIEINSGIVAKLVRQIDPQYPEFWAREIIKSESLLKEKVERANFEEEWVERMVPKFLKNEALMNRVARYGVRELDPARIALAIAKESPSTARSLGIKVANEHVHTGKREALC